MLTLLVIPAVLADVNNDEQVFTKGTATKLESMIGNMPVCVHLATRGTVKTARVEFQKKPKCQVMLYYTKYNKKILLVQSEKKVLLDEEMQSIIIGFEEQKTKSLPRALTHAVEKLAKAFVNVPSSDSTCALIKDGVCDKQCQGVDLDCLCGNDVCESLEVGTCPADCGKKEWLCSVVSNSVCEENCVVKDIDCRFDALRARIRVEREKSGISELRLAYLLGTFLAIGLGGVAYILHLRLRKKK